jgi:hypothetical protein
VASDERAATAAEPLRTIGSVASHRAESTKASGTRPASLPRARGAAGGARGGAARLVEIELAATPDEAARARIDPSEAWARADRVARRMHGEFAALVAALPREARSASGMARHVGIDRTTCQRLVFVVTRPYAGVEALSRLPGVKALHQLLEGVRALRPRLDENIVASAEAALEQFRALLLAMGGSQTQLVRRLEALRTDRRDLGGVETVERQAVEPSSRRANVGDGGLDARRRLFAAAAELTGRSSDCWVAIYAYRPVPGTPETVELVRAHGLVGHVARADAVPLTLHNFSSKPEDGSTPAPGQFVSLGDGGRGHGDTGDRRTMDSILGEFTSDPPPMVRSKQPNEFLVQSIDEPEQSIGRPVDFMLATRTTLANPASPDREPGTPAVEEAWALVNFPCRHLLFDLYLHRDLARACIPSLDAHLWRPDFAQAVGERWQTRFADSPMLQVLGPGLRTQPSAAWPRIVALTRTLFSRAGYDADEFVGFRCEVPYPIWRAGYCVRFDYARPTDD